MKKVSADQARARPTPELGSIQSQPEEVLPVRALANFWADAELKVEEASVGR